MDTIKTASRIHPLMAGAAVSVIVVSLAGTAAITGLLPSSHGAARPAQADPYAVNLTPAQAPVQGVPAAGANPAGAGYAQPVTLAQAAPAPAPVVIKETVIREVPAKPVQRPVQHHYTQVARNDAPAYYEQAPRPAPVQPNYVAIGTGAVVGGLIGNQVGSGNGRKLATLAGVIGGGFLGNQVANPNR